MSESARINRIKGITLFTNNVGRASFKSGSTPTYDLYTSRLVGAVEAGLMPASEPAPSTYNLSSELLRTFDLVLSGAAASNLGPTRSSRRYYLWFFAVATAYQWMSPTKVVNGTKDGWHWDNQYAFGTEREVCIWMLQALEIIMSKMSISYSAPWESVASTYLLSLTALNELKADVARIANLPAWQDAYNNWWTVRASDGSVAAAVPPTDSELPNGANRLDVSLTVDPASFPNPESWTPLKIGASSQSYMTYNWLSVSSPALSADNQASINAVADSYYPSSAQRTAEINEVVTITNTLTDTEKVIAEFWAGGPFTVSPPGMLLWIWKTYVSVKLIAPAAVIWSGLDLALHLFETGRLVWGLKKSRMQARPIQEIRRLYRGQTVTKYDGTAISGEAWVPYQETNFVTPPFADFPSGHSAFSRSFANVMNTWFGPTIDTSIDAVMSDIKLISPALKAQTHRFGTFSFESGDSLIQPAVVPAQPVFLSWDSWDALAESAGISRKYGGIHATSAHTGSVELANALHAVLQTNFPLFV